MTRLFVSPTLARWLQSESASMKRRPPSRPLSRSNEKTEPAPAGTERATSGGWRLAGGECAVGERAVRAGRERGMAPRTDALLVAQPFGDRQRVRDVAVHPHRQRFHPEQEQERIERGEY